MIAPFATRRLRRPGGFNPTAREFLYHGYSRYLAL